MPSILNHGDVSYEGMAERYLRLPGTLAETMPRRHVREQFVLASGTIQLNAILLERGVPITNLEMHTGNSAGSAPTSWGLQLWTHQSYASCTPLVVAMTRNGTTTLTINGADTFTETHVGRLVTGSGITGGTYVTDQPSSTTLTLSAAASGSGNMNVTFGEFMGSYCPLAATANQTTTLPSNNAPITKALTAVYTPPATGLYNGSFLMVATTVVSLIGTIPSVNAASSFFGADPPLAVTKTSQTFPGTVQMTSMTVTRNQPWMRAT